MQKGKLANNAIKNEARTDNRTPTHRVHYGFVAFVFMYIESNCSLFFRFVYSKLSIYAT